MNTINTINTTKTKTYHPPGEKCSGGKNSKPRLTGMATASATGKKLAMYVVGKAITPRCFKNIKQLPSWYRSQKKSWMTGDRCGEWIRKLNSFFLAQDRTVVLLIGSCPDHPEIKNLFTTKHDVFASTDGPRCNTKYESPLPKKNCSSMHQILEWR